MIGKKKMRRRTKFTILAMFNLMWYTIVVLVASFYGKEVPDSLTVAWFGAWVSELGFLLGLKIKSNDNDKE